MRCAGPSPAPEQGRADEAIFARANSAAARCGVTRLADITRLDRIGLPIWQAIRPAGRALSVHQGKGATPRAAQIGALCEAIESHAAESVGPDGPCCAIDDLLGSYGAPDLRQMVIDGVTAPVRDQPIQWCVAQDLITGARCHLPLDLVSLDLSWGWDSPFERSSNGLGAAMNRRAACEKALIELIENDAVGRWERAEIVTRLRASVAIESIAPRWFGFWRSRLRALGHRLTVYAPGSATGHPVFICHLQRDSPNGYPGFAGSGCHGDRERALFTALAEAIQSRLTFIAGARDDMLPTDYHFSGTRAAFGPLPPVPPRFPTLAWGAVATIREDALTALRAAGFAHILCKTLRRPEEGIAVVKAFVPGLGSLRRLADTEFRPCA